MSEETEPQVWTVAQARNATIHLGASLADGPWRGVAQVLFAMAMAPIHFEDIPLADARTMGRGPRMNPALYHAFKEKI